MPLNDILLRSKELVSRPDNDFMYSSWEDKAAALRELDTHLERLQLGNLTAEDISILFAPTGPMQELAISSGWSDEFLALAEEFDTVATQLACHCETDLNRNLNIFRDLGMDSNFAEISVLSCPTCSRNWLHIFYEDESTTGSARWYECAVSDQEAESVTASTALAIMQSKPWHLCGGSYFEGVISKSKGRITLF